MIRVEPTSTLFISNLPATTESELLDLCQSYGKVKSVQYMPDRWGYNKAFVTFNTVDSGNLALFALRNMGNWKGRKLKVNYKIEKDEERDFKTKKQEKNAQSAAKAAAPEKDLLKPRTIPGLVPEKPKSTEQATLPSNGEAPAPSAPAPSVPSTPSVPATPTPSVAALPPQFEITIRNLSSGEISYQFRPQNLDSLKQYLISEAEAPTAPEDLFQASVPYKSESVTYRGLPVAHVYASDLQLEILDPIENAELRKKKRHPKLTPLSKAAMPLSEVEEFLTLKGFSSVYVHTDVNGVLAPLLPGWKPTPGHCGFKKGPTVIYLEVENGIITNCSFVRSSTAISKELQPLFLKYKVTLVKNTQKY